MNSSYIDKKLWGDIFHNYNYKLSNIFVFKWESDFLAISNSGYTIEVEVKISRADFKNDFNKEIIINRQRIFKHNYLQDKTQINKPNKFFFAFPEGLIKHEEIPEQYGIIEINKFKYLSNITRNAKFLHKTKLMDENWFLRKLLDKFYYRNIDLRILLNVRDNDIKFQQKTIFDI